MDCIHEHAVGTHPHLSRGMTLERLIESYLYQQFAQGHTTQRGVPCFTYPGIGIDIDNVAIAIHQIIKHQSTVPAKIKAQPFDLLDNLWMMNADSGRGTATHAGLPRAIAMDGNRPAILKN